jgi:hypothetical protein
VGSNREKFESKLKKLDEVEVHLWKDSDLMCVFFRGKDFAHFHDEEEIDIRLSQKFIKKEELKPLEDSKYHSTRSKKSRWMQMRFQTGEDVSNLLSLIERLIEEDYKNSSWGA